MLKGDNLNKIDTVVVLCISNAFLPRYIGHIAASASAAFNSGVWKFIQIKNCRFLLQKAGRHTYFFLSYSACLLTKIYIFHKEKDIWLKIDLMPFNFIDSLSGDFLSSSHYD